MVSPALKEIRGDMYAVLYRMCSGHDGEKSSTVKGEITYLNGKVLAVIMDYIYKGDRGPI
jgi:hypothetical protein